MFMVGSYDNRSNLQSRFEISRLKDALCAPSTVGNKLDCGRFYLRKVLGKLPTYPFPNLTLAITSFLEQNVRLGEV